VDRHPPGTDGLFAFALIHELLRSDRIDLDYLVRYANAHWLVVRNPGGADDGLFARDDEGAPLCWDRHRARVARRDHRTAPVASANTRCPTAAPRPRLPPARRTLSRPAVFARRRRRTLRRPRRHHPPHRARTRRGRLRRKLSLPIAWTDSWGREHATMVGRAGVDARDARHQRAQQRLPHLPRAAPAAVAARRGGRAGLVPLPAAVPEAHPAREPPGQDAPRRWRLDAAPLGFVHGPRICSSMPKAPRRIDHAYSWAYPLAAHGMMHTVIRNAWAGDPYKIDTLLMFMANMSWNSAMNTSETMHWLTDKDDAGEYRIPRIIYSDAYASEMVAYADLVLPDTTYLERTTRSRCSIARSPTPTARAMRSAIRSSTRRRNPPTTTARATCAASSRCCSTRRAPRLARHGARRRLAAIPRLRRLHRAPRTRAGRRPARRLARRRRRASEGKGAPNPDQLQRYIDTAVSGTHRSRNPRAITRWRTAITCSGRSASASSATTSRS
jgi:hypothetical protein